MSLKLEKLIELTGGNTDRIKLYLDTYLEGINEQLPQLASTIENSNIHKIRTIVHTLKPLFTVVGFTELWEVANEIESNIDLNTNLDSLPSLSERFKTMLNESLIVVEDYHQTL